MKEQTDLNWPIRLALDTVLPTLDSMHASYQNLDLLKMGASTPLTLNQSLEFVTTKLQQLNGWLSMTSNLITDSLMDAWNLQDGYEKEIETTRVAHRIVAASRALYDWKSALPRFFPPQSPKNCLLISMERRLVYKKICTACSKILLLCSATKRFTEKWKFEIRSIPPRI
jgi:hypothetical protein